MSLVAWTVTHLSEYFLKMNKKVSSTGMYMTQLLLLGKFEYGGGPIFKVVLEC